MTGKMHSARFEGDRRQMEESGSTCCAPAMTSSACHLWLDAGPQIFKQLGFLLLQQHETLVTNFVTCLESVSRYAHTRAQELSSRLAFHTGNLIEPAERWNFLAFGRGPHPRSFSAVARWRCIFRSRPRHFASPKRQPTERSCLLSTRGGPRGLEPAGYEIRPERPPAAGFRSAKLVCFKTPSCGGSLAGGRKTLKSPSATSMGSATSCQRGVPRPLSSSSSVV